MPDTSVADELAGAADRAGVSAVLRIDPDMLAAAAARGAKPIAPLPNPPGTEPAFGFDPTTFAGAK